MESANLEYLNVSDIVKRENFFSSKDSERDCLVINEDKLCDFLEEKLSNGNCVVDTHSLIDYFPERWFDLVICLKISNTSLFDRLTSRGYSENKVKENLECEIMQVIANEVSESYDKNIVQYLSSESIEDLETNIERIKTWYSSFIKNST